MYHAFGVVSKKSLPNCVKKKPGISSGVSLLGLLQNISLLIPDVGEGSLHQAILWDTSWGSYNLTQFCGCLPRGGVRTHKLRAQSHYTSWMSDVYIWSSRFPDYSQLVSDLAPNQRFPWPPPPLDSVDLLEWLTELSETFTEMFPSLWSGMRKDAGEESEEETYRVKSGRVLSTGAFVSLALGWITFPICGCAHKPGSSLNPKLLGFFKGGFTV